MATATKKAPAVKPLTRGARGVLESAPLEFLVYRDNGGDYHWEIVDGSGEILVHSAGFASHDDAARAARCVHKGARSARFEFDDVADECHSGVK
jgi:uncharacterized protein YegP (UPF0339 family)